MNVRLADREHFLLGTFAANLSSGLAATTIPDRWQPTWENNLAMAKVADAGGLDFILPVARYVGYGGETNFQGASLDPITLAAAMLPHTSQITVFSTVHTAFVNPVLAAKQLSTVDQIGNGRMGVNIVAGWNRAEYDMFGVDLPQDHDSRYALAQEWWDVVTRIWSSDDTFEFEGDYFQHKDVRLSPRPRTGVPPVLNAGSSSQGRDFGARNADLVFTVIENPESAKEIVASIRADSAAKYGRSVGAMSSSYVVCRPTTAEATEYVRYYAEENADSEAVQALIAGLGATAKTFTPEQLSRLGTRFAAGHGSVPLVGTPDEVAAEIERYAQSGLSGLTLAFIDYVGELEYFVAEVLPRLEKRGVRTQQQFG